MDKPAREDFRAALLDENDRLRAALSEIADCGWVNSKGRKEGFCHPEGCDSPGIARKALSGVNR